MNEVELTVEQQFSIAAFEQRVQELNEEDTKKLLIETYRTMLEKDASYRVLLKKQWGIE